MNVVQEKVETQILNGKFGVSMDFTGIGPYQESARMGLINRIKILSWNKKKLNF